MISQNKVRIIVDSLSASDLLVQTAKIRSWTDAYSRKLTGKTCGIIGGIKLERYEKTKQIIKSIFITRGLVWD